MQKKCASIAEKTIASSFITWSVSTFLANVIRIDLKMNFFGICS